MDTSPVTQEEVERWARGRQPHEREPLPEIGERLFIRTISFGPHIPAFVLAVADMTDPHDHWLRQGNQEHIYGPGEPDPNVWVPVLAPDGRGRLIPTGELRLTEDPWPWVQVQEISLNEDGEEHTGPDGEPLRPMPRWVKEARVRGSAGWFREGSRAHTGEYV